MLRLIFWNSELWLWRRWRLGQFSVCVQCAAQVADCFLSFVFFLTLVIEDVLVEWWLSGVGSWSHSEEKGFQTRW